MNAYLNMENTLFTCAMVLYLASMVLYFVFFVMKKEKPGQFAGYAMVAAFALHTAALVVRGIGAKRLPLTNQYEFATSFAWGIALCALVFIYRFKFRALGTFVSPVIFLVIGYAAMQGKEVRELMPALRSNWLAIHVSAAIIGYGAFGVSFAVSVLFLLREKKQWQRVLEKARTGERKTGSDQLSRGRARVFVFDLCDYLRCYLGGARLGKLLVMGSERDLGAGDLDHLCGLFASAYQQGMAR